MENNINQFAMSCEGVMEEEFDLMFLSVASSRIKNFNQMNYKIVEEW